MVIGNGTRGLIFQTLRLLSGLATEELVDESCAGSLKISSACRTRPLCADNARRSEEQGRSSICTRSGTEETVMEESKNVADTMRMLTIFSINCGRCLRTVLTA